MLQERYAKNIKMNYSLLAKHINMSKVCQKDNIKVKAYMLTHSEFTNLKFKVLQIVCLPKFKVSLVYY